MTAVLECRGVSAGYEGVPVVRGLDLFVNEAEIVALLGPNGSGKTTTLLTLSGLLRPLAGEVRVLGEPVQVGRPHLTARRGLAHVPDDKCIFYGLSVRDNLRLAVRRRRESEDRIAAIFEFLPALEPLRHRRAGLLSGGEQQMLALGRALASTPKVLMIDELSLGLAPVIVKGLLQTIRRIAQELGTAVLLVEQHVDSALQVADRGYVLSHGDLVLTGIGSDLAQRRDILEASYMGEAVYEHLA